jgi:hypothetical protein
MFQDIIRLTVQRIFNDKILLGLLIVCLLGFFVGGFNQKEEPPLAIKGMEGASAPPTGSDNNSAVQTEQSPVTESAQKNYAKSAELAPNLAVDFVKWWMKAAMDYSPQSAVQSHEAASNWMSPEAYKAFMATFWPPDLAEQISSGATVGAFQPISIQAEAVNPDHTVVVGLSGTLVLHAANGRPNSTQIQIDILVRKGDTGLRITGINNRLTTLSPSVY